MTLIHDGPEVIRVLVVAEHRLGQAVDLALRDIYPIRVTRVVQSQRQCRVLIDESAPCAVLIGESLEDGSGLQLARELARIHPDVAPILLSERAGNPDFLHEAFAAQARAVVPIKSSGEEWSVTSVDLEPRIIQAWETLGLGVPPKPSSRHTLAVFAATGGVGKSVVAANLAAQISTANPRLKVLILDLDLQAGVLAVLLNQKPTHTISDFARIVSELDRTRVEDMVQRRDLPDQHVLYFIPAPQNPLEGAQVEPSQIRDLLTTLRRYFDILVLDTPSQLSSRTLPALEEADEILLLCRPDVVSLRQTRLTLQLFETPEFGLTRPKLRLILNHIRPSSEAGLIHLRHVEGLFSAPIVGELPPAWDLLQEAMNSGRLPLEVRPDHPWNQAMERLLVQTQIPLSREPDHVAAADKSWGSRIWRRLR